MAKQTIGIGSAANDGTGDPLRTAFSKVNDNFNEVYSAYEMTGKLSVGNSTVNTTVSNTSGLRTGNSTFVTTVNSISVQVSNTISTATLAATNLSIGSNVVANLSAFFVGNSTVNSIANSTMHRVANGSYSANLTAGGLVVGNNSINSSAILVGSNVVINTSAVAIGNSTSNVVITQTGISGSLSFNDVVITGNLTVNGTVTTVNTATLDIADINITVAKNAANAATANGAGLTIGGANSTIRYISDSNNFVFSHTVEIGNSSANATISPTNYSGTANNTSYVGSVTAANVVSNAQLAANLAGYVTTTNLTNNLANYQTTAGLSANVATLTSNNATNLGGVAAAAYVQNTDSRTLSGNLYFTGANNVFASNTVGLGSSTIAANGYTYLPNGLKMNWGVVSANNSDGNIAFTSAFSTALYTITVTGTNTEVTTIPAVISANTIEALVRTSNTSSVNVYFTAIGL